MCVIAALALNISLCQSHVGHEELLVAALKAAGGRGIDDWKQGVMYAA